MRSITLRAPVPDDVAPLTAMFNMPEVRRWTLRLPYTGTAMVRRRVTEPGPQTHNITACCDGVFAGFGTLIQGTDRRNHSGEIAVLAVRDDMAGQGVGRALMTGLVDLADRWLGLQRLELSVDTENTRACALYQSFGFEVEATCRGDTLTNGVLTDTHVMGRLSAALQREASV